MVNKVLKRAVQTSLLAGQATFHHGLLVHSSPSNKSLNRRRCGLTAQYVSAKSSFKPNYHHGLYEEDWRTPVLISGEDRSGQIKYATTLKKLNYIKNII